MSARPRGPARRRRPPAPVKTAALPWNGRTAARVGLLVEVWLLVVGIVAAAAPNSPAWLRVLGAIAVVGAVAQSPGPRSAGCSRSS